MLTTTAARPATDRQLAYIRSLLGEREVTPEAAESYAEFLAQDDLTTAQASAAIDHLRPLPRRQAGTPLEAGVYVVDGAVVKLKLSQAGRLYSLRWVESSGERIVDGEEQRAHGDWSYEPALIRRTRPEHRMTVEEAKNFAVRYGQCANCGRTLKAAESVERGIGPVCIKRFAF
jgi:outer membrane biosynthesis protein TonB